MSNLVTCSTSGSQQVQERIYEIAIMYRKLSGHVRCPLVPRSGYQPARASYDGYAPPSYGYRYQPARSSYGGYTPTSYGYGYAP